ncbi:Holliday junction branch migration protein RuvA [Evansella cellulosilytica]|uniref:Holliday junction branch migration complex subunit RuvA n=1 Tax=Evansella cellulosilytica (strain ATCC 21833 / DSM 2522 / FERM P-1141 / JCM 9156 / N-4) TaxID=649639 RepID=E6TV69_EVAC2|nr:Holliday junction branch migration protein RuvA [Evansella cellulosilytica]ADU29753.1 Holliday junction DNA helicase RuvA [Evansella cellulosilytica DSM 2522]
MIESLTGVVSNIEIESVTLNVHDVGYLVFCANPFRYEENINEKVTIYTYQHVREDAIKLYGFKNRDERKLFEKLLQVSGIGPKGALAILATGEPTLVVQAIEAENEKFLVKFPGVGKKTARQIILDLKGKLVDFLQESGGEDTKLIAIDDDMQLENYELEEALEALKALGYVDREINKVLPKLKDTKETTDGYIKIALKLMLES